MSQINEIMMTVMMMMIMTKIKETKKSKEEFHRCSMHYDNMADPSNKESCCASGSSSFSEFVLRQKRTKVLILKTRRKSSV